MDAMGEFRGRKWEYELGAHAISNALRPARDVKVTFAATRAMADRARGILDRDVLNGTPGTFTVIDPDGNWTQRGYGVEFEPSSAMGGDVVGSMTVVLLDGVWRRWHTKRFSPDMEITQAGGWLDFPHDYLYDFAQPRASTQIAGNEFFPSPVIIKIPGPVENPSITIGGNLYEVLTEVPANATLVINSVEKTVEVVTQYGASTNVFQYATRGSGEGGGKYIFQKLPAGYSSVVWDGNTVVEVSWADEEGEPPWNLS